MNRQKILNFFSRVNSAGKFLTMFHVLSQFLQIFSCDTEPSFDTDLQGWHIKTMSVARFHEIHAMRVRPLISSSAQVVKAISLLRFVHLD